MEGFNVKPIRIDRNQTMLINNINMLYVTNNERKIENGQFVYSKLKSASCEPYNHTVYHNLSRT